MGIGIGGSPFAREHYRGRAHAELTCLHLSTQALLVHHNIVVASQYVNVPNRLDCDRSVWVASFTALGKLGSSLLR
jgi:hypothetical protein